MLILSRKVGERFLIGENVVVQVLDISGSHVKLGIDAPKNTKVFREELLATPRLTKNDEQRDVSTTENL